MKHFLAFICLVIVGASARAEYAGDLSIYDVMVSSSGEVYVGFTTQPPATCSHWGWYVKFSTDAQGGKNMLSTLLTAHAAGKTVRIWYVDSTAPGTNQTTGCGNAMAILDAVALPQN